MTCEKQVPFTEGDTEPFAVEFPGVDLTGYALEFHIGYAVPLVIAGTLTDAPNGKAEFPFTPTDLIAGDWNAEIQVTKPGGILIATEKFIAHIEPEIA